MTEPLPLDVPSLTVEAKRVLDTLDAHTLAAIALGQDPGDDTARAAEATYDAHVEAIKALVLALDSSRKGGL